MHGKVDKRNSMYYMLYFQIPLVFVLMTGRRKRDYVAILEAILDLFPEPPRVQRLMADFEAALWRAARVVLPAVRMKGCSFHLRQAIYRKVDIELF